LPLGDDIAGLWSTDEGISQQLSAEMVAKVLADAHGTKKYFSWV